MPSAAATVARAAAGVAAAELPPPTVATGARRRGSLRGAAWACTRRSDSAARRCLFLARSAVPSLASASARAVGVLGGELLGLGLGVGRATRRADRPVRACDRAPCVSSSMSATSASSSSVVTSPALSATLASSSRLQGVVEIVGVLEQRAEWSGTTADERAQRHLARGCRGARRARLPSRRFAPRHRRSRRRAAALVSMASVYSSPSWIACSSSRSSSSTMSSTFCFCWSTDCACTTAGVIDGSERTAMATAIGTTRQESASEGAA